VEYHWCWAICIYTIDNKFKSSNLTLIIAQCCQKDDYISEIFFVGLQNSTFYPKNRVLVEKSRVFLLASSTFVSVIEVSFLKRRKKTKRGLLRFSFQKTCLFTCSMCFFHSNSQASLSHFTVF
jgi:hypothetical protein